MVSSTKRHLKRNRVCFFYFLLWSRNLIKERTEFEPFNEDLRQQVQDHQDLVLKKTVKVTDLRKTMPAKLAELQKEEAQMFADSMNSIKFGPETGKQDASTVAQQMKGKTR